MSTTTYTLVTEFDGDGPRVGLNTPVTVNGETGRMVAVSFSDALAENDLLRAVMDAAKDVLAVYSSPIPRGMRRLYDAVQAVERADADLARSLAKPLEAA